MKYKNFRSIFTNLKLTLLVIETPGLSPKSLVFRNESAFVHTVRPPKFVPM